MNRMFYIFTIFSHRKKKSILKHNNNLITLLFCIFNQINTALVSRRDLFLKTLQILLIPNLNGSVQYIHKFRFTMVL